MRGYPKHFNSKQDYYNIIRDDLNREKTTEALKGLLSTSRRMEPVWPDGYDPNDPNSEPMEPAGWKEVEDPNGKIFRISFTLDDVNVLIDIVCTVQPFQDKIKEMHALVERGEYFEAERIRGGLTFPAALSAETVKALDNGGELETLLDAEDKDKSLSLLDAAKKHVQDIIDSATGGI